MLGFDAITPLYRLGGDSGSTHCDEPSAGFDLGDHRQFLVHPVEHFDGVHSIIEPRTVRGFDLLLLHPDRVGVIADGCTEVLVSVDQVRAIDWRAR